MTRIEYVPAWTAASEEMYKGYWAMVSNRRQWGTAGAGAEQQTASGAEKCYWAEVSKLAA
jgi:hypothetical protein